MAPETRPLFQKNCPARLGSASREEENLEGDKGPCTRRVNRYGTACLYQDIAEDNSEPIMYAAPAREHDIRVACPDGHIPGYRLIWFTCRECDGDGQVAEQGGRRILPIAP